MLVSELKKVIEKYDNNEQEKIIVELYKKLPKRVKEDYDIDNYILNVKDIKKASKEEKKVTFDELEKEINYFIDCANQGLYASPNRIISKDERSKWRFKVKRYCKELNSLVPDSEDGNKATDLLKRLYYLLSKASCYLTFSNWETFKAIQISQAEFLEMITKRKLANGVTRENLKYCVELLDVTYDPYEGHWDLLNSFESCLKTPDTKYLAIELLKDKVDDTGVRFKEVKGDYRKEFDVTEMHNYFVECIIDIYFSLCEVDEGIKYFHKEYYKGDKEIKEYILLEKIDDYELYNDWINEYEKHLGKISYRDSLKERYKELKGGKN